MTDKNEFNRLSLDLVSSYIITLFGNYMEEIVDITKNIFSNSDIYDLKVKILKKSKFSTELLNYDNKTVINEKYKLKIKDLHNTIVGLNYNKSNDAHWIYIDNFGNIHNSYNNGLQVDGSNQFCQCYALLMAVNPYYRYNFKSFKNSYLIGYKGLIELWKLILKPVINFALDNYHIHRETIKIIYDVNKDEDISIINYILRNYFDSKTDIFINFINILESTYALQNAPFFI